MDPPNATMSGRVTAVRVDDGPEPAPGRETTMKVIVQDRYGPPDVLELSLDPPRFRFGLW